MSYFQSAKDFLECEGASLADHVKIGLVDRHLLALSQRGLEMGVLVREELDGSGRREELRGVVVCRSLFDQPYLLLTI